VLQILVAFPINLENGLVMQKLKASGLGKVVMFQSSLEMWLETLLAILTPKIPSVFWTKICSFDTVGKINLSKNKSMRI
jgi:hypothetical protein